MPDHVTVRSDEHRTAGAQPVATGKGSRVGELVGQVPAQGQRRDRQTLGREFVGGTSPRGTVRPGQHREVVAEQIKSGRPTAGTPNPQMWGAPAHADAAAEHR